MAKSLINVDMIYPIGSIYMSVNSTNPSNIFGGTWAAWGAGRVPVGVDTSQSEFASVEQTGGSKYMQEHRHGTYMDYVYHYSEITGGAGAGLANWNPSATHLGRTDVWTDNTGSGNSGNLQPYITCYMWKRTA